MSTIKNKRIELVMSEEDKRRMDELKKKYDCSAGYVLRVALKKLYDQSRLELVD